MARIMPEQKGNAGEKREDWLKIELFAPAEMIDALSNFMTEIGSRGAYQESLESQFPNGFPEPSTGETLKAFLPVDVRLERRIASLQTYRDSLAEIFPELERPTFRTEIIRDPDWGVAWKKYFKPLRVSRNIVIKPTWERYTIPADFVPTAGWPSAPASTPPRGCAWRRSKRSSSRTGASRSGMSWTSGRERESSASPVRN
jgi:ribosomal protein L11 methylase PrmA